MMAKTEPIGFFARLSYIIMVLLISAAVYKTLMQMHAANFNQLLEAAYGVIEGRPHWKAYQNRLLGPYSVYLISLAGFTYSISLRIYIFLMVFVQNILLLYLLQKSNLSIREALVGVCIYSFVFLLIQDHSWFYTWDSIDSIIFTLFAYGIFKSKQISYFIVLFFVSILNRESALFIALYIFIDAFYYESIRKIKLVSVKKVIIGICLIIFGITYINFVRDHLFISSKFRKLGLQKVMDNHINFINNIENIFVNNVFSINIINSIFIIGSIIYFVSHLRSCADRQIKIILIYCTMIASTLLFGLVNETRMFIVLIPFIIFYVISSNNIKNNNIRYSNQSRRK